MFDMSLPENQCYCLKEKLSQCDGWVDVSGCMEDTPLSLSLPHFYNSKRRQREVRGLQPDPERHLGYMDIQPNLGIPINAKVGLQMNIEVESVMGVSTMSNIRATQLPMLWLTIVNLLIFTDQTQTISFFAECKRWSQTYPPTDYRYLHIEL